MPILPAAGARSARDALTAMLELYPQIRLVHILAVVISGTLFLLRGVALQAGARWGMAAPLRYLSYGIDTVLLGAALMLVSVLPSSVFANGWLATKVVLLVVYIGLGSFALKRGRTALIRRWCYIAALFVFLSMFIIARTHDPLGPFILMQRWLA